MNTIFSVVRDPRCIRYSIQPVKTVKIHFKADVIVWVKVTWFYMRCDNVVLELKSGLVN